ncbi:MAG: hypothetical protein ACKVS5_12515 [Parvularculaceae bacterium]
MTTTRAVFTLSLLAAVTSVLSAPLLAAPAPRATLAAIAPDVKASLAFYEAIEAKSPAAALGDESAYRAYAEAMRGAAKMAFGSFATEDTGVVARDVVITFGKERDAGLKLKELRLYGFGADAGGATAERIDARGVQSFGLAEYMERLSQAYVGAIVNAAGAGGNDQGADEASKALAAATAIGAYDMSVGRIIADGFVLHAQGDNAPGAKAAPQSIANALALYAAAGRATSFRAFIMRDMKMRVSSGVEGAKSDMTIAMPFIGQRGYARGDLEELTLSDMTFSLASTVQPLPPPTPPAPDGQAPAAPPATAKPVTVSMTGGVGQYLVSGLRLGKVLDYWSRGKTPPTAETDLMSLGVWQSWDEHYEMGGAPVYSLQHATTDFSNFHWMLPTSIKSTVTGLAYDVGGFMKFAAASAPADGEAGDLTAAIALLEKHKLSKLGMDMTFDYTWLPKTGAATLNIDSDMAGIGRLAFDVASGLPAFKDIARLEAKGGKSFDADGLAPLFAASTYKGFTLRVADAGVLTRGFAFAADMQAQSAGAPSGSIKPQELRAAAALGLRSMGAGGPNAPLFTAFADFISEGGAVSLVSAPVAPVPFLTLFTAGPGSADPVARFGLSATHAPAQ